MGWGCLEQDLPQRGWCGELQRFDIDDAEARFGWRDRTSVRGNLAPDAVVMPRVAGIFSGDRHRARGGRDMPVALLCPLLRAKAAQHHEQQRYSREPWHPFVQQSACARHAFTIGADQRLNHSMA